jgi:hypothetical protein
LDLRQLPANGPRSHRRRQRRGNANQPDVYVVHAAGGDRVGDLREQGQPLAFEGVGLSVAK